MMGKGGSLHFSLYFCVCLHFPNEKLLTKDPQGSNPDQRDSVRNPWMYVDFLLRWRGGFRFWCVYSDHPASDLSLLWGSWVQCGHQAVPPLKKAQPFHRTGWPADQHRIGPWTIEVRVEAGLPLCFTSPGAELLGRWILLLFLKMLPLLWGICGGEAPIIYSPGKYN